MDPFLAQVAEECRAVLLAAKEPRTVPAEHIPELEVVSDYAADAEGPYFLHRR